GAGLKSPQPVSARSALDVATGTRSGKYLPRPGLQPGAAVAVDPAVIPGEKLNLAVARVGERPRPDQGENLHVGRGHRLRRGTIRRPRDTDTESNQKSAHKIICQGATWRRL